MTNRYPLHHEDARPLYLEIPQDEYDRINSRIAELERMDTEHTVQIAKMNGYIHHLEEERRWRKFSEENPKENDYYLVTNGDFVDFEYGCYNEQDEEWNWDHNGKWEWWMPLPMLPEEDT